MNYIYAWITSIILSTGISIANELRMYKDAADNGYRIDGRNLNSYIKEYPTNIVKNLSLALFIPIINIFTTVTNVMAYSLNRSHLLDNLGMMDAIEEMTPEEKDKYQKFPTGLHALFIMIKNAIKLSKYSSVQIKTSYDVSEIYFDIKEDGDIEVVKVYGMLSKATKETQKEKVMETLYGIALAGLEVYGTQEEFINAVKANDNIDLNLEMEEIKNNQERIKELEELKEELLSDKEKKPKTRKRKK